MKFRKGTRDEDDQNKRPYIKTKLENLTAEKGNDEWNFY